MYQKAKKLGGGGASEERTFHTRILSMSNGER